MRSTMRRFLIDCDAGVDDAVAIALLAHAHKHDANVRLEAITCVAGNASVDAVVSNVRTTLRAKDVLDVPVFRGASTAMVSPFVHLAPPFHGQDGFGDAGVGKCSPRPATGEHAANAIARIASEHEGELEIVCIGPLTNLALAARIDETLPSKVWPQPHTTESHSEQRGRHRCLSGGTTAPCSQGAPQMGYRYIGGVAGSICVSLVPDHARGGCQTASSQPRRRAIPTRLRRVHRPRLYSSTAVFVRGAAFLCSTLTVALPCGVPQVKSVVWMGGTLEARGNSSKAAEFNIHADPEAAHVGACTHFLRLSAASVRQWGAAHQWSALIGPLPRSGC